jgi:anti-sigma-K factor RskA
MSNHDIHTLTGAYALDALEEIERLQFQAHLNSCPDCAQEVHELRAAAARLGIAVSQPPPETLRHTIMAQVAVTRQSSPTPAPTTQIRPSALSGRGQWRMRLTASAAALAAAAALVLAVVSVRTEHERDTARTQLAHMQAMYGPVTQLAAAPDARAGAGPAVRGGTAFVLASHELDAAVLLVSGLPTPPGGRIYQAWLIGHGHPRSVGLINLETTQPNAPLQFHGLGGATKIGLTIEPAGGSPQPTTTPIALFDLPT